ncbi:hypothetical protein G9A89_022813 [Geosiphon pyriformis]|nr:hypothetical protein G9A89_022813 [Geosiphon pyriformis]
MEYCLKDNDFFDEAFKKKWFKGYDKIFTKESSRFHKLEILVSRIVKAFCEENSDSKFAILHGDNFSMLKETTTQSLIFAVGSVVEYALEKNCKLWLVL